MRAGTEVSGKRHVLNQAVCFRRLPYSVIRGRLLSQINTRLNDVTSLHLVTFTVTTLCGSNVDSFGQVSTNTILYITTFSANYQNEIESKFFQHPRRLSSRTDREVVTSSICVCFVQCARNQRHTQTVH
jgi:hypothetical protein